MIQNKRIPKKRVFSASVCVIFSLVLFSGCKCSSSDNLLSNDTESPTENAAFEEFLNEMFCAEISSNTINLHYTLADPEAYGITDYEITLGDLSEKSMNDENARCENYLSTLESFDYNTLSLNQQLTYDVLDDYLKNQLDAADLYLYDEPLRSSTGVQANLPILYEEYAFYDREDIEDYLKLIALTDEYFDQIIAFEQKKADAGLFMSDFSCDNIISQCEAFTADVDDHYLIETFNNKIDAFEGLTDEERDTYKMENESLLKENVFPAYKNLASAMTALLGSGNNDKGLCYFPDGKEYYEYLVYYNTGCSDSIKEIEDMVTNERVKVLQETSDITNENPDVWEEAREVSLSATDATTTLNKLKTTMLSDFPAPPESNFTVSYIDDCVADYLAPAFYVTAPLDNYTNNSIYINESIDTSDISYFTTLAHEGYPGHLYQTVMSYEAGLSPARCMLNYPGFVEGWATYVEMLSYSYAGLDADVAQVLQYNQSAILSLYASTDLGIHYEGWTFDDTLVFWDSYGISDEDTIREIYELIIEEPAHYLKYYIGYLQFDELKTTAKAKYLYRYNDISFHQALLNIGPAPFDIVEKYLDDYYPKNVKSQK